jgi:folylpolyglutamate synthase/dihydropteroate synthase
MFTSPHINCFRERVQINGIKITEEEVVAYAK